MKVTLREKKLLNNRRSLYLDFYPAITIDGKQTRREFLSLYIYEKPKTELERDHNKETKLLAQNICAKRQLELQANPHGFISHRQRKGDFLVFFRQHIEERKNGSESALGIWENIYYYFSDYCGGACAFDQLNSTFIEKFKEYLLTCQTFKTKTRRISEKNNEIRFLSTNTAQVYLDKLGSIVKKAHEKGLLGSNPMTGIKKIKRITPEREFLFLDELQTLAKTDCPDFPAEIRRAALLSALTGLRYSDVKALVWKSVRRSSTGWFLDLRIKKTGEILILPISDEACELLGTPGEENEKVFPNLKCRSNTNFHLQKWMKAAGITRHITFHCFRRTFATGQISEGTDLFTVQKMLGHSDIRQTQIYAALVDEKKREAANRITLK